MTEGFRITLKTRVCYIEKKDRKITYSTLILFLLFHQDAAACRACRRSCSCRPRTGSATPLWIVHPRPNYRSWRAGTQHTLTCPTPATRRQNSSLRSVDWTSIKSVSGCPRDGVTIIHHSRLTARLTRAQCLQQARVPVNHPAPALLHSQPPVPCSRPCYPLSCPRCPGDPSSKEPASCPSSPHQLRVTWDPRHGVKWSPMLHRHPILPLGAALRAPLPSAPQPLPPLDWVTTPSRSCRPCKPCIYISSWLHSLLKVSC